MFEELAHSVNLCIRRRKTVREYSEKRRVLIANHRLSHFKDREGFGRSLDFGVMLFDEELRLGRSLHNAGALHIHRQDLMTDSKLLVSSQVAHFELGYHRLQGEEVVGGGNAVKRLRGLFDQHVGEVNRVATAFFLLLGGATKPSL